MRLVPTDKDFGWTPYVWLVWLGIFLLQPVLGRAGWKEWLATALGVRIFLALYFGSYWVGDRRSLWVIAAMAVLGVGVAPFNVGGVVFIVYAATLVPFAADTWLAAKVIAALVAVSALEAVLLHLGAWFGVIGTVLPIALGSVNIHFAQRNRANRQLRMAQDEIEHLARVAERERIARDLHDVLGHTLSVVILKSELAGKLMDRDPQRAGTEIREVEQISRQALSEVRDAIRGYRSQGLAAELVRAKSTLETAGVVVKCEAAKLSLPALQESVLSMAVREAVTNVVRHAQAHICSLRLEQQNGSCRLAIEDDGRGGMQNEGNGLRGMRERVEMLGGTLDHDSQSGTRLTITLPLKQVMPKPEGSAN